MESEKVDVSETNIVVDNVEMFEKTIGDLKQNKGTKTVFTKAKMHLLLIQENITVEKIDEECEQLELNMEELLKVTGRLLAKHKLEKDRVMTILVQKQNIRRSSQMHKIMFREFCDELVQKQL